MEYKFNQPLMMPFVFIGHVAVPIYSSFCEKEQLP
jgi:hypothetical protein